jgi:hypothetical protein
MDDLEARHPERESGLELGAGNRQQPGADDLRGIGAEIERDGEEGGGVGREPDPEIGQAEEDKEELDQERGVAESLDIASHRHTG